MALILSGTNGLSDVDGSAATPAIRGTDANTGIFFPAADTIAFSEGGAESMRLNSAGRLGIGTTTPSTKLDVQDIVVTQGVTVDGSGSGSNLTGNTSIQPLFGTGYDSATQTVTLSAFFGDIRFYNDLNVERMRIAASGNVGIGTSTPGAKLEIGALGVFRMQTGATLFNVTPTAGANDFLVWNTSNSGSGFAWNTNSTERARIDASGNLLVGTTSARPNGVSVDACYVGVNAGSRWAAHFAVTNTTGSSDVVTFSNPNGVVGRINLSGTTTSYVTSSDYRLKETVQPMTGALAKVSALKPVTYKWKVDGSDGQGFIAHELQAIVPDCVIGEKDAVDADGKPVYQGIDTSFLVATLTAAMQEQQAIIESLTARVAQLEAK